MNQPIKSTNRELSQLVWLLDTPNVDFSSKLVIILAAALLIFNGVLYWSGTYPFSNVSSMSSIPAFKANDKRIGLVSIFQSVIEKRPSTSISVVPGVQ